MCDCCERSKATGGLDPHGSFHCEDAPVAPEEPVEDRGLLTDDAAIGRYFAFIAGGLFGVFMCYAIPVVIVVIIETFGFGVR